MSDTVSRRRWAVRAQDLGLIRPLWCWEVLRDGQVIDTYADPELAQAYVDYMNGRAA